MEKTKCYQKTDAVDLQTELRLRYPNMRVYHAWVNAVPTYNSGWFVFVEDNETEPNEMESLDEL